MQRERIYCNSCKGDTWHEAVGHHEHERYDYFWGYSQLYVTDIFKCSGCEDVMFRLVKHPFSFQDEKDKPEEFYYPDRSYKFRDKKFYFNLPANIHKLYHETVVAHDNELTLLSTVGLRSLLEAVVADKVDSSTYKKTLESKIDALRPFFPTSVIDVLHEFRLMGNKAAHDSEAPEGINFHHALNVAEGVLEYFYSIEEHAKMFRDGRKKAKRKSR